MKKNFIIVLLILLFNSFNLYSIDSLETDIKVRNIGDTLDVEIYIYNSSSQNIYIPTTYWGSVGDGRNQSTLCHELNSLFYTTLNYYPDKEVYWDLLSDISYNRPYYPLFFCLKANEELNIKFKYVPKKEFGYENNNTKKGKKKYWVDIKALDENRFNKVLKLLEIYKDELLVEDFPEKIDPYKINEHSDIDLWETSSEVFNEIIEMHKDYFIRIETKFEFK